MIKINILLNWLKFNNLLKIFVFVFFQLFAQTNKIYICETLKANTNYLK